MALSKHIWEGWTVGICFTESLTSVVFFAVFCCTSQLTKMMRKKQKWRDDMNIRSGSIILKEIDTIISENPDTKPVLKCCQRVENCVLGLLRKAYSGENIVNLIDAYRRESKQN